MMIILGQLEDELIDEYSYRHRREISIIDLNGLGISVYCHLYDNFERFKDPFRENTGLYSLFSIFRMKFLR